MAVSGGGVRKPKGCPRRSPCRFLCAPISAQRRSGGDELLVGRGCARERLWGAQISRALPLIPVFALEQTATSPNPSSCLGLRRKKSRACPRSRSGTERRCPQSQPQVGDTGGAPSACQDLPWCSRADALGGIPAAAADPKSPSSPRTRLSWLRERWSCAGGGGGVPQGQQEPSGHPRPQHT